ncbi:MAG: hypothetical protein ACREAK_03035 [Nitrosarchaeum sp.]
MHENVSLWIKKVVKIFVIHGETTHNVKFNKAILGSKLHPKSLSDFYQFALHLIYAVIIGQSFLLASVVFVPLSKLYEFSPFENGFALFLAYTVTITGWIGWSRSITKHPHSENSLGNFRFIVDLIIMFLYYYLINLTDPKTFGQFKETFIWVFPAIFLAYIAWDGLKTLEYRSDPPKANLNRKKRNAITVYFFLIFVAQAIIYVYVTAYQPFLTWNGNIIWNEIFISSSVALTIAYRWLKWKIPVALRRRKKPNKNKSTG